MTIKDAPRIVVSVIVSFFKRQTNIEALLNSFGELDIEGFELEFLVVEDGSTVDNKDELIRRHAKIGLKFLTNAVNRGPGYSRNLAVRESRGTYLWFLDSDTEIVRSDTLVAIIAALDESSDRVAIGGSLELINQQYKVMIPVILPNFQFLYEIGSWTDDYEQSVPFLSTCNLFISKERFIRTGGFDVSLKMFEDNEFCLRLLEDGGGEFHQNARTLIYHKIGSHGRDGGAFDYFNDHIEYLRIMLHVRNTLLHRYRRWLLAVLPFADLMGAVAIARGVLIGRWNMSRMGKAKKNGRSQMMLMGSILLVIVEFQLKALMAFLFPRSCQTAVREPAVRSEMIPRGNNRFGGIPMGCDVVL